MLIRFVVVTMILAGGIGLPERANGDIITFEFDGQLEARGPFGVVSGVPFVGVFSFDSQSPDLNPLAELGVYEHFGLRLEIGDIDGLGDTTIFFEGPQERIVVFNTLFDGYSVKGRPTTALLEGGLERRIVGQLLPGSWDLVRPDDPAGSLFQNDVLPLEPPPGPYLFVAALGNTNRLSHLRLRAMVTELRVSTLR